MSQYHGAQSDHNLRWYLIEHSPSILKAPTFCIHVNKAIPHKDIRLATTLNELLMNKAAILKCPQTGTCLNCVNKSDLSGVVPSHCICWKSWIAFSSYPSFTYFESIWFHAKGRNCTMPGAIAAISASMPGAFCLLSSQSASPVFLCLKSR